MFGCAPVILPSEAKEGWDFWSQATLTMEPYMKDVHFFRQFCVAWIFSSEYRLQHFLPTPYPLSLVRIYKIKWWPEFKSRLCGKENVDYFCKNEKRKFTLHNPHLFEKSKVAPATPSKKETKKKKVRLPHQKPKQEDCRKRRRISLIISRMTPA